MRISTQHNDSGHAKWNELLPYGIMGAKVFLNDVEVQHCLTADEELGEVLCHRLQDDGKLIVVDNEIVSEWRHGTVRIEWQRTDP